MLLYIIRISNTIQTTNIPRQNLSHLGNESETFKIMVDPFTSV